MYEHLPKSKRVVYETKHFLWSMYVCVYVPTLLIWHVRDDTKKIREKYKIGSVEIDIDDGYSVKTNVASMWVNGYGYGVFPEVFPGDFLRRIASNFHTHRRIFFTRGNYVSHILFTRCALWIVCRRFSTIKRRKRHRYRC